MDGDIPATGAQIVYLSHGGGPLPLLGDPGHDAMVAFMRQLGPRLRRPDAVLVVSAHWEERVATVQGGGRSAPVLRLLRLPGGDVPRLVPRARRPCARRAHRRRPGRPRHQRAPSTAERGFDHGAFIPLLLMYPEADIPALQLSLLRGLDPEPHIALGSSLGRPAGARTSWSSAPGSRSTTWRRSTGGRPALRTRCNDAFQDWLIETCTGELAPQERERRLRGLGGRPERPLRPSARGAPAPAARLRGHGGAAGRARLRRGHRGQAVGGVPLVLTDPRPTRRAMSAASGSVVVGDAGFEPATPCL